jgi:hypothetical protein
MAAVIKLVKYFLVLTLYGLIALLGSDDVRTWTLDDFEDGDLIAAPGVSWIVIVIADDLGGGATVAHLDVRPGGVRALRRLAR